MHGNDVKFEFCDPRFVSYRKRSGLSPDVGVTTESGPKADVRSDVVFPERWLTEIGRETVA